MSKAPAHYYEVMGDVNGRCDHYHRTLSGAATCELRRQRGCQAHGGYSDAHVYEVTGDQRRLVPAWEYDDDARDEHEDYLDSIAAADAEEGE